MDALGIKVVFVPCLCTWLLQPLDVYAFRRYKALLRAKVQDARACHPNGDLSKVRWLLIVIETIEESIVGRRWANEFMYVGIANGLQHVSSYIHQQLGDIGSLPVSSEYPSDASIAALMPRGRIISAAIVYALPVAHAPLALEDEDDIAALFYDSPVEEDASMPSVVPVAPLGEHGSDINSLMSFWAEGSQFYP